MRFLIYYLLCGLGATLFHFITNPNSTVPAVGASGAIAGVMAAYLFFFPFSRIIATVPVFFTPYYFELPAFIYTSQA